MSILDDVQLMNKYNREEDCAEFKNVILQDDNKLYEGIRRR